ncbi:hypothetical protein ACOMHN_000066 [Nucella lapillus]
MSKRYDSRMAPEPLRFECCPSVSSRIRPLGGLSREGKLLQLFRSDRVVQQLYETRCRPDVVNKPCQMVDPLIKRFSHCVQKYSYVYAFVKDFNMTQDYRLDYVRVRSGCACEVDYSLPETREYH